VEHLLLDFRSKGEERPLIVSGGKGLAISTRPLGDQKRRNRVAPLKEALKHNQRLKEEGATDEKSESRQANPPSTIGKRASTAIKARGGVQGRKGNLGGTASRERVLAHTPQKRGGHKAQKSEKAATVSYYAGRYPPRPAFGGAEGGKKFNIKFFARS